MTDAQQQEATGDTITVDYGGHTYTIDRASLPWVDLMEAVDDGKYSHALKALLGPEQYAAIKGRFNHDIDGLREFLEALMERMGNWSASPAS